MSYGGSKASLFTEILGAKWAGVRSPLEVESTEEQSVFDALAVDRDSRAVRQAGEGHQGTCGPNTPPWTHWPPTVAPYDSRLSRPVPKDGPLCSCSECPCQFQGYLLCPTGKAQNVIFVRNQKGLIIKSSFLKILQSISYTFAKPAFSSLCCFYFPKHPSA